NHVAASLQSRTNELVVEMAEDLRRRHDTPNVCIAGRLAENSILVRALEAHFGVEHVYVPPAPGIESLSVGAALFLRGLDVLPQPESRFLFPALGPEFSDFQIKADWD